MKPLIIGIAPLDYIKQRTTDIVAGKIKPSDTEPKVWFTSLDSCTRILNNNNHAMLDAIRAQHDTIFTEF